MKMSNDIFFEQVLICLKEGKKVRMFVQGNSMFPFLWNGDEIVLLPAERNMMKKGDIVLAKTEIGIILHRILKIDGDVILLMGDGNVAQVEHTKTDDVYGIVQKGFRKNRPEWDVDTKHYYCLWQIWHFLLPIRRILIPIARIVTNQSSK